MRRYLRKWTFRKSFALFFQEEIFPSIKELTQHHFTGVVPGKINLSDLLMARVILTQDEILKYQLETGIKLSEKMFMDS